MRGPGAGSARAYAHAHLGQALYGLGRYRGALAAFERALALRPKSEQFRAQRQRASDKIGR